MPDDKPHFDDAGRLIAPRYDDVYFSAEDGLAETRHVFLEGNRLAERFAAMKPGEVFTIGETGFGTGLNFLAAWRLFVTHAPRDTHLEYVSTEGFPLDAETMRHALLAFKDEINLGALVIRWRPAIWPGAHRFVFTNGRVRLIVLIGEVSQMLEKIEAGVDAWFLDGFAPSRNPEMWSSTVFHQVARLSAPGATLATYTAAGFVRRGLQAVGFEITKRPGFGTKRDMTTGRLTVEQGADLEGDASLASTCSKPSSCLRTNAIVIGGSLAGSFVARSLAERGVSVTVVERQVLVDGVLPSLVPRVAVLQPKISDINDSSGQWLREGYAYVLRRMREFGLSSDCGWVGCGTFQAAWNDRSKHRLNRFIEQFGGSGLCRWIDAEQTRDEIGFSIPVGGVIIDGAGVLRPARLCVAMLEHPRISVISGLAAERIERVAHRWHVVLSDATVHKARHVIVANALDALRYEQTQHLDLRPVRGQVTLLRSADQSGQLSSLRRAIFYGGYILPEIDGEQTLGASFVSGTSDLGWRDAEHVDCCDKLAKLLPEEADRLRMIENVSGWVGIRTSTPSSRCYAEQVEQGLYVSLGHGSHGISSSAAAGEHIAAMVAGGVAAQ